MLQNTTCLLICYPNPNPNQLAKYISAIYAEMGPTEKEA